MFFFGGGIYLFFGGGGGWKVTNNESMLYINRLLGYCLANLVSVSFTRDRDIEYHGHLAIQ